MRFATPIPYGDYLLTERIGVGGTAEIFAAVRRGREPGDGPVALKRLLPHIAEDRNVVRLLQREVAALELIDHPNVVRLLDHGTERTLPYLVMELVDGVTLQRLIKRDPAGPTILPTAVALSIVADIAFGLAAAWRRGVVHRDVSPSNTQVTATGDIKILDFGLARVRGMVQTTHGQGLKGKWAYLSPEQIDGLALDGRSDLFALGSVLYQLLIGRPPFAGENREDTLRRIRENDRVPLADASLHANAIAAPKPEWMPEIAHQPVIDLVDALLAHDRSQRPIDGDAVALRTRDLLGAAVADQRFRTWLSTEVDKAAEAERFAPTNAAEIRGESVTDPHGETVTNIEAILGG